MEDTTGTHVGLCTITTSQAVLNGKVEGKDRTVFWWNLNVTQRLWPGAKLITNTRGGSGNGLEGIDGSKHNTNWTRHEPECVYVSHLYLEQKLFDDKLTLDVGKLDTEDFIDTNKAASWDFLSYSLARNPTIPCHWHAIGAVARYDLLPWLYVQGGVADAQGSWTETGLNTAFHDEDYFVSLYEVGLTPKLGARQGNYRFILWYDPQPLGRIDGSGVNRDDLGFGLSFDQEIADGVTAFMRYGYADESVREIEHYWSTGATWTGPIPGRREDVLGFGVGQFIMGGDYRRANQAAHTETIFELYYKIKLAEWCSISPDLQAILNPGASRDNDVGVIAGLKLVVGL